MEGCGSAFWRAAVLLLLRTVAVDVVLSKGSAPRANWPSLMSADKLGS